jgi:hypothetical protein
MWMELKRGCRKYKPIEEEWRLDVTKEAQLSFPSSSSD